MTMQTEPSAHESTAARPRERLSSWARRLLPAVGFFAAGVLLLALAGLAQRWGWIPAHSGGPAAIDAAGDAIYTCPMHPQIRQPTPGRCPICGMELVVATSGVADLDEFAVRIEPAQRRLANIQTAPVERGPLEATLQTVGAIAVDESRQATIAAYIAGRLERLYADYTGVDLQQGDHLAVIYSPALYAAQVEYLEARRGSQAATGLPAVRAAAEALAANTRQRLREFGLTDAQLAELEQSGQAASRLTIYAPQGGTVVEKLAVEGAYVEAGDPIYRIAELSTVWLMLRLFPEDANRVRFGQRVQALVQSLPGQSLTGRVAFIDPTVDPATRTVGVRVELLNEDRRLRPGDYATATIQLPIGPQGDVYDADLAGKWISPMHPQIIRDAPGPCPICGMDLVPTADYGFAAEPLPQPESLYVPRSAVLLAGEHSVVYVETEPGYFELRPVQLGPILRDQIVLLAGVAEGEQVATAGNFLIDSQMQLAGKPSLIDPARALARRPAEGPLEIESRPAIVLSAEAGALLDELFAAYLQIQATLAADETPAPPDAQALHQSAAGLAAAEEIPPAARELLQTIAAASEHLHHLDLAGARDAFKTLSHALLPLAAELRGAAPQRPFTHFYCPMVPGGGGDWLQATDELRNPYFGSEMLRCGENVGPLAPGDAAADDPANAPTDSSREPPPAADDDEAARSAGPRGVGIDTSPRGSVRAVRIVDQQAQITRSHGEVPSREFSHAITPPQSSPQGHWYRHIAQGIHSSRCNDSPKLTGGAETLDVELPNAAGVHNTSHDPFSPSPSWGGPGRGSGESLDYAASCRALSSSKSWLPCATTLLPPPQPSPPPGGRRTDFTRGLRTPILPLAFGERRSRPAAVQATTLRPAGGGLRCSAT